MQKVDYSRVTEMIAAECKRQMVGPVEMLAMHRAYKAARTIANKGAGRWNSVMDIGYFARIIEPVKGDGYRTQPATFANMQHAVEPSLIKRSLQQLVDNQTRLTTDEFVKEFLDIHPYADGNGRVAFLLYNVRNNTLHYPNPLPDYYG